jgi:peptidoglycan/LPS O-acetylase OafA/YrhL
MVEWVTATVVGRVARIFVLVAMVELTAGMRLEGSFAVAIVGWTLLYASMGAVAGLVMGTAQSYVLERHVIRPRWWVWVNMGASAVVLAVVGWLPNYTPENTFTGLFTGLVTGVMTGIALNDLLREPLSGRGWWLTWKRERPVKPSLDPGTQRSPEVLLEELRAGRRP